MSPALALRILLSSLLPLLAAPDDAAELQALVQKFFEAASKKDAAAAAAVWSPSSRHLEIIRACVAEAPTPITDVGSGPFSIMGEVATAIVHFKGRLTGEDGRYADETLTRWWVLFRREGGAWKWAALEPLGYYLSRELPRLATREERRAVLEAHKDGVTFRLVKLLADAGSGNLNGGNPDLGRRQIDAAVEAAAFSGREDLKATALLAFGEALITLGRSAEAVDPLRGVTAYFQKGRARESAASAGISLGYALLDCGRPEEAIDVLANVLETAEKDSLLPARFHAENYTGMAQARRGALATALLWHQRAASTAQAMQQPVLRAQALLEIGRLRWELGDFGGALEATMAGLKLSEAPEQSALRAKLLNTMGLIYQSTAEHARAQERLEAALALWRTFRVPRGTASILSNLAEVHRSQSHDAEAENCLTEAIALLEEAKDLPTAIAAHNNLGLLYRHQGKVDAAIAQYRACARAAKESRNDALLVTALVNLAEIHAARGLFEEALKELEEASGVAERHGAAPQRFQAHQNSGQAFLLRRGPGDLERAVASLRKAAAALEGSRAGLRDPALKQSFLAQHAGVYPLLAGALHELDRDREAFAASEEGKARTLVDLLQGGSLRIVKSMTEEERREEARQDALLRALEVKLEVTSLTDDRAVLEEAISKNRESLEEFRRGIYTRHPDLEDLRGRFSPASLETLNRRLLSGPVRVGILSYLVGPTETLLFVLTSGPETATVAVFPISIAVETLKLETEAFRTACSVAGGEYRDKGRALYGRLIAPAETALKKVDRLVVVPDGVLNGLPFQALQDSLGMHLMERWTLSFAPSVTALLKMEDLAARRRAETSKDLSPLLSVGAPRMPAGFADLPHAKAEAEAVAARYRVAALTGEAATETAVKPAMEKAKRILISTHGKVDEASPLYSFVVLARDDVNDGLLTAKEIVDLNLKAELVVLSACETALGKQIRGEGVVGLTWALFAAGTPATVLSQWQVSDESTGGLMEAFMAGMSPGVEFAEALKQAQLSLLKDPKRAHPYYWAPFILIGAGRS